MWAKCLQRSYIAGHTAAICDVDSHHTITRSFLQFCFDEFLLFWTDEFWDRRDLMYLQTTGATVNANFDKFFMWSVGKLTSVSINMNTKCLHHPLSIILVTLSLHGLHYSQWCRRVLSYFPQPKFTDQIKGLQSVATLADLFTFTVCFNENDNVLRIFEIYVCGHISKIAIDRLLSTYRVCNLSLSFSLSVSALKRPITLYLNW